MKQDMGIIKAVYIAEPYTSLWSLTHYNVQITVIYAYTVSEYKSCFI